jgi:ankyrin repeat protein
MPMLQKCCLTTGLTSTSSTKASGICLLFYFAEKKCDCDSLFFSFIFNHFFSFILNLYFSPRSLVVIADGLTPLILAFAKNRVNVAKLLVLRGADVTIHPPSKHYDTRHFFYREIYPLINDSQQNASPNTIGKPTLLFAASVYGDAELVKLMLDHGARVDLNSPDKGFFFGKKEIIY